MHVCGGQTGREVWFGVVFDSREEAERVKLFLENGAEEMVSLREWAKKTEKFWEKKAEKTSVVDSKQTERKNNEQTKSDS